MSCYLYILGTYVLQILLFQVNINLLTDGDSARCIKFCKLCTIYCRKIEKYFQKSVLDQQINLWNNSYWLLMDQIFEIRFLRRPCIIIYQHKLNKNYFGQTFSWFFKVSQVMSSTLKNHQKWWQKIKKSFWNPGPSINRNSINGCQI